MLYVRESSGVDQLGPTVKFRDYLPDGGWIVIDLPSNFVLQIIQEEVYREVAGQFSWTSTLPVPVTKPRYFISPCLNFWNVDYFYVNRGSHPDTTKITSVDTTLSIKSTPGSGTGRYFVFTLAVLGIK